MKLKKRVLAAFLTAVLFFSLPAAVSAAASPADRAMEYYAASLKGDFEDGSLSADLWHLACLSGTGKLADEAFSFLQPVYESSRLTAETSSAELAKAVLGQYLLKKDPRSFEGRNLVSELAARMQADGTFPSALGPAYPADNVWSIVALSVSGEKGSLAPALENLIASRTADNGWNSYGGATGEIDFTGMAMEALALNRSAEGVEQALAQAVEFLRGCMDENAFFVGRGQWDTANTCSQAYAIMGLVAAGEDVQSQAYSRGGKTPVDALLSNQDPDNGGFWYDIAYRETPSDWFPAPDDMSTYQAIISLCDVSRGETVWAALAKDAGPQPMGTTEAVEETTGEEILVRSADTGVDGGTVYWILGLVAVMVAVIIITTAISKKKK